MFTEHVTSEVVDPSWDAFLASVPGGHHEQSSLHAQQRVRSGYRCVRITMREDGSIVGGAQVLVRVVPTVGQVANVLRGPVVAPGRDDVLEKIAGALERVALRERIRVMRVYCFPGQDRIISAVESAGFKSDDSWFDGEALGVALEGTEDEILAGMKPKGRYNIRLAARKGVTVREGDGLIPAFFELHKRTSTYQGFPTFPLRYFGELWEVFGRSGKLPVFVAFHDGDPVAAIMNTVVEDRVYYGWGGMSREPHHRVLMANYLTHWTAMKWAKRRGYSRYEFVDPSDFTDKIGSLRYKWPNPRRRFFGKFPLARNLLIKQAWKNHRVRGYVDRMGRLLYGSMPY